jgi:hypothetical protein
MDLLTALMHEMRHQEGERDLDPAAHANELMAATLKVGVRRGPPAADVTRPGRHE